MKNVTVLLTGAGAPGAPGIIKALRKSPENKIRIIGTDINAAATGAGMTDKFYLNKKAEDNSFCPHILSICKREEVDVIIPIVTRELPVFAKNKDVFEAAGVKVAVMDSETLEKANNKAELLETLGRSGVCVPEFERVSNISEFKTAVQNLGYPDKPVCFKPTVSNGSRGFRVLSEQVNKYNLLFDYKPSTTYADYLDICKILESHGGEFRELIVTEYLPGDEYSVDILADKGDALVVVPRIRKQMNGGISTVCTTENNKDIIDYCKEIVGSVRLDGFIGIQVKNDTDSRPRILEINPRLQGSVICSVAAGANLPCLGVSLLMGEKIKKPQIRWGVSMARYYEESFFDEDGLALSY